MDETNITRMRGHAVTRKKRKRKKTSVDVGRVKLTDCLDAFQWLLKRQVRLTCCKRCGQKFPAAQVEALQVRHGCLRELCAVVRAIW